MRSFRDVEKSLVSDVLLSNSFTTFSVLKFEEFLDF